MFEWLQRIACVNSVRGQVRDLHIELSENLGEDSIRSLRAMLKRYKMTEAGLDALLKAKT